MGRWGCLPATHLGDTKSLPPAVMRAPRPRGWAQPAPPGAGPQTPPPTLSPSRRSAPVAWSTKKRSSRSTRSFSLMEVSLTSKKTLPHFLFGEQPSFVQVHAPCDMPPPRHRGALRARCLPYCKIRELAKAAAEKGSENGPCPAGQGAEERLREPSHEVSHCSGRRVVVSLLGQLSFREAGPSHSSRGWQTGTRSLST